MLAGSRWQAGGVKTEALPTDLRRRFIAGIEDEHDVIAGAAVQTVVALGLKKAAPIILSRLKDEGNVWESQDTALRRRTRREIRDVFEGTRYGGTVGLSVLSDSSIDELSLVAELLAGLEAFRYQPATEHLHTMLKWKPGLASWRFDNDREPDALDVLVCLDPERKTELLITVLHNAAYSSRARWGAAARLADTKDLTYVAEMLPLLKEDSKLGSDSPNDWEGSIHLESLSGHVASEVAKLLQSADQENPSHGEIRQRAVREMTPMLRTPDGPSALAALTHIQPENSLDLVMRVTTDRTFPTATRHAALDLLSQTFDVDERVFQDVRYLKRLLPLIEDDTRSEYETIGQEVAGLVAKLTQALAENPVHAEEVARVCKYLASHFATPHAPAAFMTLQQIDPKQAAESLMVVINDHQLAPQARARALELTKDLTRDAAFVRSLASLLADQTVPGDRERICDLVALITAEELELAGLRFPLSYPLKHRDAFVERVRKAVEEINE